MSLKQIFLGLLILIGLFACKNDEAQSTPSDFYVALPSPPVKMVNTSGTWLVYEMHIKTPSVQKVDISNAENELLTYTDFNSSEDMHLASIWLPFPENGWNVSQLNHRFTYLDAMGNEKEFDFNLTLPSDFPDPITIQFPVPHGVWIAEGAPGANSYHTRALFSYPEPIFDEDQNGYLFGNNPQRYAIDYALLIDGLPYENDGTQLSDWHCYNLPILAAEGGTVVFTRSDIPDNQTPGELDYETGIDNATGNVVYIKHPDGSIGTYCHMVPNSVLVEVGDEVTTGQEIGRLGNSGNSFGPHLHMHVLTNPENQSITEYSDGFFMESLPYRFADFTKLGALPPGYLDESPLVPFVPTMSESCQHQLPSESDVIEF
ncbi:M23 family metallopeptidase [Moheibacter lacus]|nr:M23 family metallopeptidase [Moheibacter lacus]